MEKIIRMTANDLRALCISESWYTNGNNNEYDKLLTKANDCENITLDILKELAEDIIDHSKPYPLLLDVINSLNRICNSYILWEEKKEYILIIDNYDGIRETSTFDSAEEMHTYLEDYKWQCVELLNFNIKGDLPTYGSLNDAYIYGP